MAAPRQVGVGPRTATEAEWRTSPLILDPGEEGVAWDTRTRRIGDGIHTWAALPAPDGEPADLAPILARVEELETEVDALSTPAPAPPPPDGEEIPDPVVIFENGLL